MTQFQPIVPKNPIVKIDLGKVNKALSRFAFRVVEKQTKYPPVPAGSKYTRTGRYGQSWTKRGPKVVGFNVVVEAGTNIAYGSFVGGFKTVNPHQTKRAGQIGWASVEDSAKTAFAESRDELTKAVQGQ